MGRSREGKGGGSVTNINLTHTKVLSRAIREAIEKSPTLAV